MAGGYERVCRSPCSLRSFSARTVLTRDAQVNARDEDDHVESTQHHTPYAAPNSPPPSFRSRASSPTRHQQVDPTLADAFDDPDDSSDDEGDDRQRLVRQNTAVHRPAGQAGHSQTSQFASASAPNASAQNSGSARLVGGGNGSDGVFANMSARPERVQSEKEEMPPVSACPGDVAPSMFHQASRTVSLLTVLLLRHTNKPQRTPHHHIGKQRSSPPASAAPTRCTSTACPSAPSSHSSGTA